MHQRCKRTLVCVDCRKAVRRGLGEGATCAGCHQPMKALSWKWRIPRADNDKGWLIVAEMLNTDQHYLTRLRLKAAIHRQRYQVSNRKLKRRRNRGHYHT